MASQLYHEGNRALQDAFGSRRIADRLEAITFRQAFTETDRSFIESAGFFFLATADAEGRPDCSFKGGPPGFVRVTAPDELLFPDFDGNGMFKSLGNIRVNPAVGLLFIAMGTIPARLRVNGTARVLRDDPRRAGFVGAQLLVEVRARAIFPNCPRYIPSDGAPSPYLPQAGTPPTEPAWKSFETFRDAVPPRAPAPGIPDRPETRET
ncbi:MAG: pyridoxamine 5'-phosphate oxidase family protein [Rhodobacteraceae bacterium]|nr:pyridoxamine 5'-phosphate oxidase family protein [Paracoccaceae bacterium]